MEKIDRLGDGDVLVLAGSIPYTMPDDIYQRILERIQGRGVLTVVDATRDLLVKVLPYHPFLVKPNNHELGDIFGVKLSTREEVVPYGRKLQEMGAQNVLISMAGEGAVLIMRSIWELLQEAPVHFPRIWPPEKKSCRYYSR